MDAFLVKTQRVSGQMIQDARRKTDTDKKLTTLGIPRRSPIQVLTEPDVA